MIVVRQNGKPRIVTCYGKVICEFDESGIATADEAYTFDLTKLGYTVEGTVLDEVKNDTGGETAGKTSRSKRSRNTDSD